ncbi:MAG: hypothetical protein ACXVW3_11175 [Nocardioidaceae bacterium]
MTELTISARFNGPARSGNGGYVAGALAELVPDHPALVEVTLRQPPPLDVAMSVADDNDDAVTLTLGGALIASARAVDRPVTPVEAVSTADAKEAMAAYAGLRAHPFPTCFGCGPERAEGDGLRIFPGPVGRPLSGIPVGGRVASLWTPHPHFATSSDLIDHGVQRVGVGVAWAALDCTGGWAADLEGRAMVLGRMTAGVDALPVIGEPHVVVGQQLGSEGRKTLTASTVYDSDGRIVARAEHTWIEVDPAAFN